MFSGRKKFRTGILLYLLILFFIISAASAEAFLSPADEISNPSGNNYSEEFFLYSNTTVYVFYSTHCAACTRAMPVIEEVSAKHPNVTVNYYNLDISNENLTLFSDFGEHFNISFPGYPIIYTGDTIALEGYNAISSNIEEIYQGIEKGLIPDREYERKWYIEPVEYTPLYSGFEEKKPDLNLYLVLTAGLFDGINPCAFSVLVFLLISLTAAGSKRRIFAVGFSYIIAVYLLYIMAGIGIMSVVSFTGFSVLFSVIAGVIAVTAGLLSMMEGIYGSFPLSLKIPAASKGLIKSKIKKATIPAAFALGILVGLFELPCTGGIYLAVLSLLSSEMTFYEGLPYLILYNLMFVLPLFVITGLVYFGLSPDCVNRFRENHRRKLKVIVGTILLFIGFFVVFQNIA